MFESVVMLIKLKSRPDLGVIWLLPLSNIMSVFLIGMGHSYDLRSGEVSVGYIDSGCAMCLRRRLQISLAT